MLTLPDEEDTTFRVMLHIAIFRPAAPHRHASAPELYVARPVMQEYNLTALPMIIRERDDLQEDDLDYNLLLKVISNKLGPEYDPQRDAMTLANDSRTRKSDAESIARRIVADALSHAQGSNFLKYNQEFRGVATPVRHYFVGAILEESKPNTMRSDQERRVMEGRTTVAPHPIISQCFSWRSLQGVLTEGNNDLDSARARMDSDDVMRQSHLRVVRWLLATINDWGERHLITPVQLDSRPYHRPNDYSQTVTTHPVTGEIDMIKPDKNALINWEKELIQLRKSHSMRIPDIAALFLFQVTRFAKDLMLRESAQIRTNETLSHGLIRPGVLVGVDTSGGNRTLTKGVGIPTIVKDMSSAFYPSEHGLRDEMMATLSPDFYEMLALATSADPPLPRADSLEDHFMNVVKRVAFKWEVLCAQRDPSIPGFPSTQHLLRRKVNAVQRRERLRGADNEYVETLDEYVSSVRDLVTALLGSYDDGLLGARALNLYPALLVTMAMEFQASLPTSDYKQMMNTLSRNAQVDLPPGVESANLETYFMGVLQSDKFNAILRIFSSTASRFYKSTVRSSTAAAPATTQNESEATYALADGNSSTQRALQALTAELLSTRRALEENRKSQRVLAETHQAQAEDQQRRAGLHEVTETSDPTLSSPLLAFGPLATVTDRDARADSRTQRKGDTRNYAKPPVSFPSQPPNTLRSNSTTATVPFPSSTDRSGFDDTRRPRVRLIPDTARRAAIPFYKRYEPNDWSKIPEPVKAHLIKQGISPDLGTYDPACTTTPCKACNAKWHPTCWCTAVWALMDPTMVDLEKMAVKKALLGMAPSAPVTLATLAEHDGFEHHLGMLHDQVAESMVEEMGFTSTSDALHMPLERDSVFTMLQAETRPDAALAMLQAEASTHE